MSSGKIPVLPAQFKSLNHVLKIATEHDVRDPIVAYWCRFYAVQTGLTIDKTTPEAKGFLVALLNWLDSRKRELIDNEAITNETVAEAHIENYAIRIFKWADNQDRAGVFNKNVVKTFYTAGILIDVLTNFNKGELSEDLVNTRKYAKWKAAYINTCLKNGETPKPGPIGEDDEDYEGNVTFPVPQPTFSNTDQGKIDTGESSSTSTWPSQNIGFTNPYPPQQPYPESHSSGSQQYPHPSSNTPKINSPVSTPSNTVPSGYSSSDFPTGVYGSNQPNALIGVGQITKAQKYIKWAGSALNFDDVPTAITNLEKALHLLKTGTE